MLQINDSTRLVDLTLGQLKEYGFSAISKEVIATIQGNLERVSREEARKMLGVSNGTLSNMIKSGRLPEPFGTPRKQQWYKKDVLAAKSKGK